MPTVTTACGPIFCLDRGRGAVPVIAIHGAGGTSRHWGRQLPMLAQHTRVIALDLPGHGRSPGDPLLTLDDSAGCVLAFLDALVIERAVLLGHSLGGAIALKLAATHPDRVAGVCVIGSGAQLPIPATLRAQLLDDPITAMHQIAALVYAPGTSAAVLQQAATELRNLGAQVLRVDYAQCAQVDLREALASVTAPVLVIVGAADRITSPATAQWLAQQLPRAERVQIAGAGHMVMLEQSASVTAAIQRFLQRITPERMLLCP